MHVDTDLDGFELLLAWYTMLTKLSRTWSQAWAKPLLKLELDLDQNWITNWGPKRWFISESLELKLVELIWWEDSSLYEFLFSLEKWIVHFCLYKIKILSIKKNKTSLLFLQQKCCSKFVPRCKKSNYVERGFIFHGKRFSIFPHSILFSTIISFSIFFKKKIQQR